MKKVTISIKEYESLIEANHQRVMLQDQNRRLVAELKRQKEVSDKLIDILCVNAQRQAKEVIDHLTIAMKEEVTPIHASV